MKRIKMGEGFELPLDVVTQTLAFLAKRGAGKTYGATKLAEEMLGAGAQVVALDPIGVWYSLRIAADGKGKGIAIPVLGGLHGDVPLEPASGALVANLLVDRGTSAVLDVSMMRKGERKRFAAEFAEAFFEAKKRRKSPVHLFIEEAQVFVPQRVMPDEARMLGAFEDLVKLGRNFGVGCTLISQRPQSVNKDALNQTECLVVLQTSGAQERKALKEWIVDQGLDLGELIESLPSLQRGEAWVWSPSWLGVTKRVRIGTKRTLNASATPELGAKVEASKPLAPIDLEQLRADMASVIEKAKTDDPAALRQRIAELERQLKSAPKAEAKVVEKPVVTDGQLQRLEGVARSLTDGLNGTVAEVFAVLKPLADSLAVVKANLRAGVRPAAAVDARTPKAVVPPVVRTTTRGADTAIGKGERAMLEALVSRHPTALTRNQVALLAGYTASGGTFAKYLSTLKGLGLVETRGDELSATPEGVAAVGHVEPVDDVVGLWRGKLGGGERKLFDELVARYPNGVGRTELGEVTGYEATGGTFAKYLSTLKSIGVVDVRSGEVCASDDLFAANGS